MGSRIKPHKERALPAANTGCSSSCGSIDVFETGRLFVGIEQDVGGLLLYKLLLSDQVRDGLMVRLLFSQQSDLVRFQPTYECKGMNLARC